MHRLALALPLLLPACIEYDPVGEDAPNTVPNPPPPLNPVQRDAVVQVTEPEVDVLFVVDNSCSMDAEQNALADNFPRFMDFFAGSGLDFHIGVVSTDMVDPNHSGKLRQAGGVRYIERDTTNPELVFSQMAVMGTSGWSDEEGRAAAYTAVELRRNGARNEGFYRDEASLHLVFISDEDDQSTSNPITRGEFREWMENLKISPDLVTSHGIVWVPGTSCADAFEVGTTYANYANGTGGILFDICSEDWVPFMEELGLQTSGLKREFFLSKLPVVDTIDVKVEIPASGETPSTTVGFEVCAAGQNCDVEYNTVRNSVTFLDFVPPPLSIVRITYNIREDYAAGVVEEDLL